ncbi:structural maintenance of chromosomes protein 5 [Chrysoperla carnea]|uniref:structural maintenance of chromosomes protein 5 n=1 Tax=Chrysoperla carnea TaxID=189513 RepID=UPI001D064DB0|nr:structural maintenance of chromosomes protein 5 [Chrysoperla carnea]
MGRRGTIVRIALKNFGTYRYCELYPGPNLNLIIGPNGTGKSTIVSGIILGLGGNPKVIGRASQLGDYVKSNCNEAKIEVELDSGSEDEHNVMIQLEFTKTNTKIWRLNGKHINQKEIMDVISKFRIQVNNLCQFLPQDRVQDFAKMNNRELLINTQKSAGHEELSEFHQQLITLRAAYKELESAYEKQEVVLNDAEQRNNRIAGTVKNIQEKKNLIKSLAHLEGKLGWITYDTKRKQVLDVKNDRDVAEKEIKKYEKQIAEIDAQIVPAKNIVTVIQQSIIDKNRLVTTSMNLLRTKIDKVEDCIFKINSAKDELEQKLQEEERRKQEKNELQNVIRKLSSDLKTIIDKTGEEESIKQEMDSLIPKIVDIEAQIEQLNHKKSMKDVTLDNLNRELNACLREKQVLENVGRARLQLLQKLDNDAYRSVLWLRENRHLFKGNVFEPILLEINVTNLEHAEYIENIIPFRDLFTFTCEEVSDMNLLIHHLRVQQKIRVNVVNSGASHPPYRSYQPPIPVERIQQYGFFAYANSLFTGPEPIMKYLCRNCRIHAIPIGKAKVNDTYESVPARIQTFFSDTKKFTVSISQYTNEKSTRISEISSQKLLTLSLNTDSISRINKKIQTINTHKEEEHRLVSAIEQQIQSIISTRTALINRRKELLFHKDQLTSIRFRLATSEQNLKTMETHTFNFDDEKRTSEILVKSLINDMLELQNDVAQTFKKYQTHIIEAQLASTERILAQQRVTTLIQSQQTLNSSCNNLQTSLCRIRRQYEVLKKEAKDDYDKAKLLTDGFTPDTKEFKKKFTKIFDELPDHIEELEERITDVQTKVDCMDHLNDGVIKEYEDRVKLIESLRKKKEEMTNQIENMLEQLNELKLKWFGPLEELIDRINTRFEQYFQKMSCAGNVSIVKAENELDFEEYGLSIKVSYRAGQPLQELDQYVQSGGERAVATAIYMLALQELTNVPFRCVDEINQGMDATNERKVLELIMDTTSQPDTSQYFLLTPKLLPKLKYTETTKVHVIHNGPRELPGNHYNIKNILQNRRIAT